MLCDATGFELEIPKNVVSCMRDDPFPFSCTAMATEVVERLIPPAQLFI